MSTLEINLIQGDAKRFAGITKIEENLSRLAWILLASVFVLGVGIGSAYMYASQSIAKLESTNVALSRDINAQSVKEGLLLSLVERTGIAQRALAAAKPWGKLFRVLPQVAPESSFRSVSIDETSLVTTTLELGSVDEAVTVVTNMMSLANEKELRSPQMLSFSLKEDESVQMTVSFHPLL
ncbi:MAG TPA: hypothetical protein VJB96_03940 [Patescibacteria group bacterium]|nr:hypothetical protein [Patescibacteria group bacterium]